MFVASSTFKFKKNSLTNWKFYNGLCASDIDVKTVKNDLSLTQSLFIKNLDYVTS